MPSERPMTLLAALVAAQAEMPALQRDKLNPAFSRGGAEARYVSLEALLPDVLPVLNKHGLAVMQFPTHIDAEPALRTMLVHGESGETIEDTMLLLPAGRDPQKQGAAITYAKRQALMAILGLSADADTDGETGGRRQAARTPRGMITRKERADLFALVRQRGMSTDRAAKIIKEVAGVDKSEEIPKAKLADVVKAINEAGQ